MNAVQNTTASVLPAAQAVPPFRTARRMSSRALAWLHAHRELATTPTEPLAEPATEPFTESFTEPPTGSTETAEAERPEPPERAERAACSEHADRPERPGGSGPMVPSGCAPLEESALAASLVLRSTVAGGESWRLARELLEFCWDRLREGEALHETLRRDPARSEPLEIYAHFARSGYRYRPLDVLLSHTTALRSTRAAELMPNRRLAVANAARVAGFGRATSDHTWTRLTRATWLGATPEPWLLDRATTHSLARTVCHLTDWGGFPGGLPNDAARYIATWLPVWINVWAEAGEWDLVAELLAVSCCLENTNACSVSGSWGRLTDLQHADGLLPRNCAPVADDPSRRFTDHHHTVVMTVIAGTLVLPRAVEARRATPRALR